jgi:hypothetical protein
MTEIFSATNHENANTFLLILIYSVLIGCIGFMIYKRNYSNTNPNLNSPSENIINKNKFIESTGFISF